MELNVNVNVRIENLDQILAAVSPLVTLLSAGAPAIAPVTEDKPVKRGRPRKAAEKVEEPKVEPVVEEPKAEEPKAEPVVEEPKAEPVVEEPKAEEPKNLRPELQAACVRLSRAVDANRVVAVIQSFGYKGLTTVPVEKHAELLQILTAEAEAAEGK